MGIYPVGIVHLLRAVDADAHEPALVVEELAPFVRQQRAVGLYDVRYALAPAIVSLQPYRLAVEVEGTQHGLASVPGEEDVGSLLQLYVVRHDWLPVAQQVLFLKIVAILAT